MPSISADYEISRMQTQAEFPFLIHIYNEDFGNFYFVNSDSSITFGNHTYQPALFTIEAGEKTETSIGNATLNISALPDANGTNWIERIRNTQKRSTVRFVGTIVNNNEVEPLWDMKYTLTQATWNELTISWTMEYDTNMQILIPCDIADANTTAGCA